jgi:glycyl-tRNA synthetase beta subunit
MRNYWGIIEAQLSNPALAEVLKKDMVLKEKRNQLLEQIKATKDETKKTELTQQLKDVLGQRFDLIVQKKQLRYEELKKRLEQLQDDLKKSQAELETIKDKKEQQVQKHLDELLNRSEEIDWN